MVWKCGVKFAHHRHLQKVFFFKSKYCLGGKDITDVTMDKYCFSEQIFLYSFTFNDIFAWNDILWNSTLSFSSRLELRNTSRKQQQQQQKQQQQQQLSTIYELIVRGKLGQNFLLSLSPSTCLSTLNNEIICRCL